VNYVIVTPAYNEEEYIGQAIESVLAQAIRPQSWVIIDDDSTDKTAEIVKRYADQNPWIRCVSRKKAPDQTYYASNVYAIEEGLKCLEGAGYDYLAILDADIILPGDYYEKILAQLERDKNLGIASGVYRVQSGMKTNRVLNDRRSCPKNIMVFRKACFEEIGGFVPLEYGGEDTCACFAARMKGWKTWSFPDIVATHGRPVGTGHLDNILAIRFRQGIGEYYLGSHPLFLLGKSLQRCITEAPYIIGALTRLAGFIYAHFMREKRHTPDDVVKYVRKEQMARIWRWNTIPKEFVAKGAE